MPSAISLYDISLSLYSKCRLSPLIMNEASFSIKSFKMMPLSIPRSITKIPRLSELIITRWIQSRIFSFSEVFSLSRLKMSENNKLTDWGLVKWQTLAWIVKYPLLALEALPSHTLSRPSILVAPSLLMSDKSIIMALSDLIWDETCLIWASISRS